MSSTIVNDKIETYGYPLFAGNIDQVHIELTAYALTRGQYSKSYENEVLKPMGLKISDFGFREPLFHLLNALTLMWDDDVVAVSRKGFLNKPLIRVLEALCEEDDIGIAGSASSSKTYGVAVWSILDWYAAPDKTLSFVASNTLSGSEDRIWGAIARLHNRAKYPIGHLIDHRKMIVFEDPSRDDERDYSNAIKAVAFPVGDEGRKSVSLLRGRKNDRVRLILDELAEMESCALDARNNLSSNEDFVFCGIGNPKPGENPHRELCEPDHPQGWDSVSISDRKWKTRTGICIFISGWDSPNFEAPEDDPPFPFLLTEKKRQKMLKEAYGNENSLEYYRNFIGFWPIDTIETSVITRALISQSDTSYEPKWSKKIINLAGMDCGWSSGGDRNSVSYGYVAELAGSNQRVLFYRGTKVYNVDVNAQFEESLADKVIDDLIKMDVPPEGFGMDISGDGGKVLSAFNREMANRKMDGHLIVPISSLGTPSERIVSSVDPRKCNEVYDRRVTEYWFQVYHAFANRSIYGFDLSRDNDVASELCSRQYSFKGKKISVETKREMKKRTGKSPDLADSFVYLYELARRHGVSIIVDDKNRNVFHAEDEPEEVEFGTYGGNSYDEDGF